MVRKTILTILSLAAGLFIFAVVLGKSGIENILTPFRSFSLFYLGLYLFISFLISILTTYRWRIILYHLGYPLPISKLFFYRAIGFAFGYVTPSARLGGEPIRAMMLSKKNVPISKAYASIVLDKIMDFTMGAFIMSTAIFVLLIAFRFPLKIVLMFIGIIFGSAVAFYLIYSRLLKRKGLLSKCLELSQFCRIKLIRKLNDNIKIVEMYSGEFLRSKKRISELLIISFALWVLFVAEFKVALLIIGFDASLLQIFLVMLFFSLVIMIPVPASLGVLEAGQASAFALLHANPSLGVSLALVIRFKELLWTMLGFMAFSRKSLKSIRIFNTGKNSIKIKTSRAKRRGIF